MTQKEWPRLKGDYTGLRVRITCPIQNRGGERAEVGRTATVKGWYKGLTLSVDLCDKCGTQMTIAQVKQSCVELI